MGGLIALPGPSIEAALNARQITNPDDRSMIFKAIKLISRTIVAEQRKEQAQKDAAIKS